MKNLEKVVKNIGRQSVNWYHRDQEKEVLLEKQASDTAERLIK